MKQRGESQIEERSVIQLATRDQSNVISQKQNKHNTVIALRQLLGINTVRLTMNRRALYTKSIIYWNTRLYPVCIYLFKVKNKDTE